MLVESIELFPISSGGTPHAYTYSNQRDTFLGQPIIRVGLDQLLVVNAAIVTKEICFRTVTLLHF